MSRSRTMPAARTCDSHDFVALLDFPLRDSLIYLASLALLAACWLGARRLAQMQRCIVVTGRVESHEARRSGESTRYFPVVSFKDARGRFHHLTDNRGRIKARPARGAAVVVRYEEEDPRSAMLCSFLSTWGPSAGLAALGASCLLMLALW